MSHETAPRTIVIVDIASFGSEKRNDGARIGLRRELYRLLEEALEQASVPLNDCEFHDRGDGVLVLVRPDVSKIRLLGLFVLALAAGLHQHNYSAGPPGQMHLRAAVHAGEVSWDEHGAIGTEVNVAFRLLDAPPLRTALIASQADLAVIVSDALYQQVIRQYAGLIAAEEYREVWVDMKEYHGRAWITLRPPSAAAVHEQGTTPNQATHKKKPHTPHMESGVLFLGPAAVPGYVAGHDQHIDHGTQSGRPTQEANDG